ncbi:MAG: DUF3991 domain-containing protein [Holdemanella sp.]|nr:DUF3991 domain-containing protein [Holdemanella sp.]
MNGDREKGTNLKELASQIESRISIADAVQEAGFHLVRNGRNTFRTSEHDSLVVDVNRNKFYWNSRAPRQEDIESAQRNGRRAPTVLQGGVISFYMYMNDLSFQEAVSKLAGRLDLSAAPIARREDERRILTDLERHHSLARQLADNGVQTADTEGIREYLTGVRKIDEGVVDMFIERKFLFQLKDDRGRPQAVFAAKDENGRLCSICFRTALSDSRFRGDYKDCNYDRGWFFEPAGDIPINFTADNPGRRYYDAGKTLLVFESCIEMMSYMSILDAQGKDMNDYAYLACGSISKSNCIYETCRIYGYSNVIIGFNNDRGKDGRNPGQERAAMIAGRLSEKGINASSICPEHCNDWNDELRRMKEGVDTERMEKMEEKRFYVNVPYEKKDIAIRLGAKWDKEVKKWYRTDNGWGTRQMYQDEKFYDWRRYLDVPYEEKDAAREAGAHFSRKRKQWYIDDPRLEESVSQWSQHRDNAPQENRGKPAPQKKEHMTEAAKEEPGMEAEPELPPLPVQKAPPIPAAPRKDEIIRIAGVEMYRTEMEESLEKGKDYLVSYRTIYHIAFDEDKDRYRASKVYYSSAKDSFVPIMQKGRYMMSDAYTADCLSGGAILGYSQVVKDEENMENDGMER